MKNKRVFFRDLGISVLILGAAFLLGLLLQRFIDLPESLVSMMLVLAVFLISLVTQGYLWGVLGSLAGVLIDNFVFAFPYFAFDFLTTDNFLAALVMLCVAILTCTLTTKLKEQERLRAETETEKMRANLLRAISHDLRTPLTTIYGSCSAIIDNYDQLTAVQKLQLLGQMQQDSESLIRMVENLLSITRVEGKDLRITKTPTVLEELVDAVVQRFRSLYPHQPLLIRIPDDFISIPMDAILIEQVLINILQNAMVHAKGMTQLSFTVTTRGKMACFEISDDGCGIPKERIPHLFSGRLCTQDVPADGGRTGMGIGLSVCDTIIRAHGGTLQGGNRPEGGAYFRFRLEMEENTDE